MVCHRGSIFITGGFAFFGRGDIFCAILEGVYVVHLRGASVVYHMGVWILLQGGLHFFCWEGGGFRSVLREGGNFFKNTIYR